MNKWVFISVAVLALVTLIFIKFVLPNWGLVQMAQDFSSGDPNRIVKSIDFDSLRDSLLRQYQNKRQKQAQTKTTNQNEQDSAEDKASNTTKKSRDSGPNAATSPENQDSGEGEPVAQVDLPVPVENSNLGEFLDPLIDDSKMQDARVQAMLNDVLSPDGISRLLNGEMTQYNDLAYEVFPPNLVNMATAMSPADVQALLQTVRETPGPDGTRIMAVNLPNNGGELEVTLRQNGGSYQIVDMKIPQ